MKSKLQTVLFLLTLVLCAFPLNATVQTNYLVISEICISDAFGGGVDDEFIEIHNPTPNDIDLNADDYRLYRATSGGSAVLLCHFGTAAHFQGSVLHLNTVITSHGYYLVVNSNCSATLLTLADAAVRDSRSAMILATGNKIYLAKGGTPPANTVDKVGMGTANEFEGAGPASDPPNGGSIERLAWSGASTLSMTNSGADQTNANAYDSDNNNLDFIIRGRCDPQNAGDREHPYFPAGDSTPPVFNPSSLSASSSNTNVTLSWEKAADPNLPLVYTVFGSTNTNTMAAMITVTNATNATLTLRPGTWYFGITVIDAFTNLAGTSDRVLQVTVSTQDTQPPAFDPASLTWIPAGDGVILRWESATDLEGSLPLIYNIYLASSPGGYSGTPFLSVTNATNARVYLPPGTHYLTISVMDSRSNSTVPGTYEIMIRITGPTDLNKAFFYPNPAGPAAEHPGTSIRFRELPGDIDVIFYTVRGDIVLEKPVTEASPVLELPEHLDAGVYYLKMIFRGETRVIILIYLR